MPIYKGDVKKDNGVVVEGEESDGDEIRFPYRMAASMTVGGVSYKFDRMEGGEAVYVKIDSIIPTPAQEAPKKKPTADKTPTMSANNLPEGAILDNDFVGGTKTVGGKRYRLMQPLTKVDGKYVYLPV